MIQYFISLYLLSILCAFCLKLRGNTQAQLCDLPSSSVFPLNFKQKVHRNERRYNDMKYVKILLSLSRSSDFSQKSWIPKYCRMVEMIILKAV